MAEDSDAERAAERERKKALLVYKRTQHSSDEDDDEEEEEVEEAQSTRRGGDHDTVSVEDEDEEEDARSVRSSVEEDEEEEDEDGDHDAEEEEEEDEVQVDKDDEDESVNAPSDDDLESESAPATPRHDTDDDDESKSDKAHDDDDTEDSATESKPLRAEDDDGRDAGGDTGRATPSKLNVEEIIAARRRTGVKKECDVCHEGRNGRRAMLCAHCKTMYHSSCYRKKYNKLISATGKQWFCPDCEPARKAAVAMAASPPDKSESLARKKKGGVVDDRVSKAASARDATKSRKSGGGGGGGGGVQKGARDGSAIPPPVVTSDNNVLVIGSSLLDQELTRVTDIAMRSGHKINGLIIERTNEMLELTQSLWIDLQRHNVEQHAPKVTSDVYTPATASRSILHHDEASSGTGPLPPLSALAMVSSASGDHSHHQNGQTTKPPTDALLRSIQDGLFSLKHMIEQLQVVGIQFEVDLIRDIKVPPAKEEPKPVVPPSSRKSGSSATASRSSASGQSASAAAKQAKPGASRLYSAKQIQKLEEWYQKSSRPESSEIQSMYRIINSPEYADKELQPDGISVKQIRIWFDNRRAKERLDYMRIKMKDISTSDMDADDVKRMKAAYIDEAKEVLEARVSRLKENGKMVPLIDEADTLLLQSSERPLPMSKTSNKASPGAKSGSVAVKDGDKSSVQQKKRIRIDYVASVRKAMKDARDAGKSEDEMKLIKTAAIERARERLHVPYKNARMGPTKPLGKDEVSHIKMTMLKLLEEDAPAEELTDVVELLLSVIIPRDVLIESQLHRQLNLVLKAHKDNKELVKQTNKLLDEFNMIIEKGDEMVYDDDVGSAAASLGDDKSKKKKAKKDTTNLLLSVDSEALPGTPGASPDSPGASPDHRKSRVKFSRDQLMKLERHFFKEDTPSKKNLEKLSKKLNDIAARDRSCDGQGGIDYKQIRSWFYKRRSTNQPPQALSSADLKELKLLGPPSSSSSASATESDSDDGSVTAATPSAKTSKSGKSKASPAAPKRKATDDKAASTSNKRQKKSESSSVSGSASIKKETAASSGKQHSGRIFNVKQLATIIEEYEKNPRPTVARLEELQKILNQDDHADDHFPNPLGVTKRQIKTWFSNRRAKERLEVIRMKVHTGDKAKDGGKSSSKNDAAADDESVGSHSDDDDDDEDAEENQPVKKPKPSSARSSSAPAAAKKELFTSERNGGSDGDDVEDDDDDEDDDVDMGSDEEEEEGDQVDKDSDDEVDDDDDDDDDNDVDEDDD